MGRGKKEEELIVYGIHPVEEFLRTQPQRATELVVRTESMKNVRFLVDEATRSGIPVRILKGKDFLRIAKGRPFQGIFLRMSPFEYIDIEEVISRKKPLVALDGITDPQNFGSILRSAAFFGVGGVIIPKDRSVRVTPAVIKASAGAAARVPIVRVVNLARTLEEIKSSGYWVIGSSSHQGESLDTFSPPVPYVLVLGSEGSGLRRLVLRACDVLVRIPGATESLNVAVAGAVLLYGLKRNESL